MEIYLIGLLISLILTTILTLKEIKEENKLTLGMVLRTVFFTVLSWVGVCWDVIWIIADIAIKTENITLWSRDKSRIKRNLRRHESGLLD